MRSLRSRPRLRNGGRRSRTPLVRQLPQLRFQIAKPAQQIGHFCAQLACAIGGRHKGDDGQSKDRADHHQGNKDYRIHELKFAAIIFPIAAGCGEVPSRLPPRRFPRQVPHAHRQRQCAQPIRYHCHFAAMKLPALPDRHCRSQHHHNASNAIHISALLSRSIMLIPARYARRSL
jgi:hypothetical protein